MVPSRLAGPKEFPALAYPNATLTCTKRSRDCIKVLTPGQTKEKVDEPKKGGCFESNLSFLLDQEVLLQQEYMPFKVLLLR